MIQKIKKTLKNQLTQGASPEKLSQSLSAGLLIGCFPLLGFTTTLAAISGFAFKLNHLVLQTANYVMYPVQIILIPIYIKIISLITDVGDVPIRPDLVFKLFAEDWVLFLKKFGLIGLYAVIFWFAISAILFFILDKAFLPIIIKLKSR